MWSVAEFSSLVQRHPEGGTFWTRSHRTVRYLRNLFLPEATVAVLTDIARGRCPVVHLLVKTKEGCSVSAFSAENSELAVDELLKAPGLSLLSQESQEEAKKFLSSPHETVLPTW